MKKMLFWLCLLLFLGTSFAAVELSLDSLVMPWWSGAYQWDSPTLVVILRNNGTDTATVTTPTPAWLIACHVGWQQVFSSNPIGTLIINPYSNLQFPITLSNISTQNLGTQTVTCTLSSYGNWIIVNPTKTLSFAVTERSGWRFDAVLDQVRDPLKNKIDGPISELWVGGVKSLVYMAIDRFAVPLAVFLWVLFAIIALYKIMFSDSDKALSQITDLLTRGIVGIIIIMSAKYIGGVFYNDILGTGEIGQWWFSMITIVSQLYDLVLWPLIKVAFYIMMGVLFIILLIRVFKFVTADSEESQKKSQQIIISTVVGLFIMIASKQLVEWVYGKEELIRNSAAVTVTQIWWSFLNNANIPIIYNIIQWVMWLSGFIILAIIIIQTYRMLVNPTDESNLKNLRKTLLYALIGMLVIGTWYLIVNVVMVN